MPEIALRKVIHEFLNKRKVLVLCTCSNNVPRATPMDFYMEKNCDNFNIYIGPSPGKKLDNIRENPVVSIGIYTPMSEGKIHHNGDPLLTWMLSNVVGHYDRKDNVYPTKNRPENKIDGAIALIMALNRAMVDSGPGESVYDSPEEVWL